jgi:hypothetical protein
MNNKLRYLFIFFAVLLIIFFLMIFYVKRVNINQSPVFINNLVSPTPLLDKNPQEENFVRCPADVKKCLDGSYVGRVAPNCSFAQCP